jgi:hypothetical protein
MKDPNVRGFFLRVGYPSEWVEDGAFFSPDDAYIAHDPDSWRRPATLVRRH